MKDKDVFDFNKIDAEAYALSMGLIQAPNIKIKSLSEVENEEDNEMAK